MLRLSSAATTGPEWGQSFVFDGFGNLTQQVVTKGAAPAMSMTVDAATNRLTGSGITYDASGNLMTSAGKWFWYDELGRVSDAMGETFVYGPRNERVLINKTDGTKELNIYGVDGLLYQVWKHNGTSWSNVASKERIYFGGRLIMIGGEKVITDRLGSVVQRYGRGLAIENGGMETGVSPWYAYNGAQVSISTTARTGAQSLRVTTPIVDRGVYQEVKDLVPGRTYEFRAWVRAESGTSLAALAVCDSNYTGFVWTGVQTVGTTWQMLSVTFTATAQGVARVHLAKHDTTGAQLWDDVELVNGATAVKFVRQAYYPYGQEQTTTANDTAKFATYTRDAHSGVDYAMNRYYMSTWGRFTVADPYRESASPGNPASWNRYSYVEGDPVNSTDSTGLYLDQCAATEEITPFSLCAYKLQNASLINYMTGGGSFDPYFGMPEALRSSIEQYDAQVAYDFVANWRDHNSANSKSDPDTESKTVSFTFVDDEKNVIGSSRTDYSKDVPLGEDAKWVLGQVGYTTAPLNTLSFWGKWTVAAAMPGLARVLFYAYPSGGYGLVIPNLANGRNLINVDWHKFKLRGVMISRPHIDIPGFVKHWPWPQIERWLEKPGRGKP